MIPVAEAQTRLLSLARRMPLETVPLADAVDRFAAEDVFAHRTQPAADLSAMDGYAIRYGERPGPWRLAGVSAAGGAAPAPLDAGTTARIFTGAPLPDGADTILVQEDADAGDGIVRMTGEGPPRLGAHVRPQGSDFAEGDRLISAGDRITSARLALAAIGGYGALPVRRDIRVTILSTGDELVVPGQPLTAGSLPASNGPMLAALARGAGRAIVDGGIVRDDLQQLTAAFAHAARSSDVIVTTGGASVGDHDLVRPALLEAGASLDFWRVAMRPGKPMMAGRIGDTIVLGLPGNPVSAHVTATLFLLPLLRHLAGSAAPFPVMSRATLLAPLPEVGQRADYLRARRVPDGAVALTRQDSGDLSTLADADCLIVRAPGSPAAAEGDIVDVIALS